MFRPAMAYRCASCGTLVPWAHLARVGACPNRDVPDEGDHVLRREVDAGRLEWPGRREANPFLRYRTLLSSWQFARALGVGDDRWVTRVESLDRAMTEIDGGGFVVTPFGPEDRLGVALGLRTGNLWVKDETGNVSGSHKARHLAGVLLHLLADSDGPGPAGRRREGVGIDCAEPTAAGGRGDGAPAVGGRPDLAIASCGNAALAAAMVARAVTWPLRVFVPTTAERSVLERLHALGAEVVACPRRHGERGDPCYHRFREAVRGGAVAFCGQGPDQALTIEGGELIAWEMIDACGGRVPDRVFVQVGGGALASAVARGFADAAAIGATDRMPRVHAVQTAGGSPLVRAYSLVAAWIADRVGEGDRARTAPDLAELVARRGSLAVIDDALSFARSHRPRFMWPWETEPQSVARGILDDETYDWAEVVEAMLKTGGWPVVVEEEDLRRANDLARELTGIDADHTGTAGLAGLVRARRTGAVGAGERVAVLFTGVRRAAGGGAGSRPQAAGSGQHRQS